MVRQSLLTLMMLSACANGCRLASKTGGGGQAGNAASFALSKVGTALPETLAETQLFAGHDVTAPRAGMIAYDVRAPLWSDGATKKRFIYVPEGRQIGFDAVNGRFDFPKGTVFAKNFTAGADHHPTETRIMVRKDDGYWVWGTYRWQPDGTTALFGGGMIDDFDGTGKHFLVPTSKQCQDCHHASRGSVMGFRPEQLDLQALASSGIFKPEALTAASAVKPYINPADETQPLELRARTYLEVNCAACHNPASDVTLFDLSLATPLANTDLLTSKRTFLKKKDPAKSTLYSTLSATQDDLRMPPVVLNPDPLALGLVKAWIESLP